MGKKIDPNVYASDAVSEIAGRLAVARDILCKHDENDPPQGWDLVVLLEIVDYCRDLADMASASEINRRAAA
jgi:hypothetical protein